MPPVTVGELQVILSGDLSRLDRDMDRIDNRAAKTEKVHTAAWKRTGVTAGEALRGGMLAAERDADKIGDRTGGRLARGINQGLIRNSPLIAAAVGGALIAGAPLVMAGAAAMFAGVGAVAAAQTVAVRSAWTKLGKDMLNGAVADSAVLVPVYVDMAEQIGDAFQDMRPQIREAFADSAPLIESTTDGVIALGQNAMPGLVRAIAAGQPVFDGLQDFLASTGLGVTGLLDGISSHGPAAGAVFSSLGAIVGDLLPILGELLGQGAELAADVLPAVALSTGLTLDVLQLLGPALPPIVAGFVAMKVIGTVTPMIASAAQSLAMFSYNGGAAGKTAGMMSTAVAGFGRALPLAALGMAAFTLQTDKNEDRISDWTDRLLAGGSAADDLRAKAAAAADDDSWGSWAKSTFLLADLWDDEWSGNVVEDFEAADAASREFLASLTPQARAAEEVKMATANLSAEIARYGEGSPQAAAAAAALTAAQREQERVNGDLEMAIHGVTSAMIEQANQALAAIDSGFAYRQSVDALEDAQAALNTAIAEQGAGSEAAQRAQLALEQQTYNTALAFGQQQADLSGLSEDSLEYKRIVQEQMLGELMRLRDAAGPEMAAAIQTQINSLQASGVKLAQTGVAASTTAQQMRDLGLAVTQIPGNKTVFIDAPTAEQKKRIEDLGLAVRYLPNGKVIVTADTSPAEGTIEAFMNRRRTIQIQVASSALVAGVRGPTAATGGEVVPGGIRRDMGGPIFGPGGPTDDLVPAVGPGGVRYRLSNREWIIKAASAEKYGPATMAAVNAGTAVIGRGGSAASGRASVGGVTEKHYHLHASVTHTISLREFMALQREADALYG